MSQSEDQCYMFLFIGICFAWAEQNHMPQTLCKSGQLRRMAPSAPSLLQQIFRVGSLFITLWRTKTSLHLTRAWRSKTQFRCIPKSWIFLIDVHGISDSAAAWHRFLGLDYKQPLTDIPESMMRKVVPVTPLILLLCRTESSDLKGKYQHQSWHLRNNIGSLEMGWKLGTLTINSLIFWL